MAKRLSILFVTSEVVPFAKTGGLADVSSALPLALTELGHDVRIIAPKYGTISERRNRIHEIKRLKDIPIEVAGEETMATVKSSQVVNSRAKVQVYLVTNDKYFEPIKGIYVDPKTGKDFPNNDERFVFFQKSVLQTCRRLGWSPDIIHCNDWQTGLIPAYVKHGDDEFFADTRTVFTIHNISYQGNFPKESFERTGLPASLMKKTGLEHNGEVSFMKAGIVYADAVTTVSPSYAREITTAAHGCGLESVVKKHKGKLHGILNGVDTEVWNPKTDKLIETKYDAESLEGKFENKVELLKRFGMTADVDVPTFGMIGRMVPQKGYDLILELIEDLSKIRAQFIFLGEGDKKYQKPLERASRKHDNIGAAFEYSEELAHLIQAGSDLLLMPSDFEPCGLNQLYAMAYGTVPVVHKTGGLADSVTQYSKKGKKGNGFLFSEYSASGLKKAIEQAVSFYEDEEAWEELQTAVMEEDHSWKASAEEYVEKAYS